MESPDEGRLFLVNMYANLFKLIPNCNILIWFNLQMYNCYNSRLGR